MAKDEKTLKEQLEKEIAERMIERRRRLNEAVQKNHLTLIEMEKLTGIGKSTIQRYLTGETTKIPIDFFEAMASITNYPVDYLACLDKQKNAPICANRDELTEVMNMLTEKNEDLVKEYADFLLLKQQSQAQQDDQ